MHVSETLHLDALVGLPTNPRQDALMQAGLRGIDSMPDYNVVWCWFEHGNAYSRLTTKLSDRAER